MRPFVIIGVPTYGTVSMEWCLSRKGLQTPLGASSVDYPLRVSEMPGRDPGEKLSAARNAICDLAVEVDAKWVFFIDDDVLTPPDAFMRLHRLADERGLDLVTGVYWSKTDPPQPLMWREYMEGPFYDWHVGDVVTLDWSGMGCQLIRTEILKSIEKPWFNTSYKFTPEQQEHFPHSTEDIYFFLKAKDAGFQLWCDTSVQCVHQDRDSGRQYAMPLTYSCAQPGSEKKTKAAERAEKKLIANLGAGYQSEIPIDGYGLEDAVMVRYDIDENVKPDVLCDVRSVPEPDQKFDAVYTSHVLEHFPAAESRLLLDEWVRLIKVDGEIITIVPNLEPAIKAILEGEELDGVPSGYKWWIVYGQQKNRYDVHQNGFTEKQLRKLHESIPDLTDVTVSAQGYNLVCHARKHQHTYQASICPDKETPDLPPPDSDTPDDGSLDQHHGGITNETQDAI